MARHSLRSREGYLLIDHSASPGLEPGFMERIGLYGAAGLGEGRRFETATLTCCHCGGVVPINPMRSRPLPYCAKCDDYVCNMPRCHKYCTPFQKVLDQAEKKGIHHA